MRTLSESVGEQVRKGSHSFILIVKNCEYENQNGPDCHLPRCLLCSVVPSSSSTTGPSPLERFQVCRPLGRTGVVIKSIAACPDHWLEAEMLLLPLIIFVECQINYFFCCRQLLLFIITYTTVNDYF